MNILLQNVQYNISCYIFQYSFTYLDVNKINTLPSWLPTYEELRAIKLKAKPADLCIRETRWTEEKLKQLYIDLRTIRLNVEQVETSMLLKRKYKLPSLPSTPYHMHKDNAEKTQIDQLTTFIQKIVRGRALQCMVIIKYSLFINLIFIL